MNRRNLPLFIVALLMIGGAGGMLTQLRANQRLGSPAVRTHPIEGSIRLQVDLPDHVLDFKSETLEPDKLALQVLPKDTSFGQKMYKASDGFEIAMNVVLMGSDRTSLHKPQICLSGLGWRIDEAASLETAIPVERPFKWELPVTKLVGTKRVTIDGREVTARGVYVYWFVAENQYTARHWQRMVWMARDLLRTGVLQRWAYISCFAVCPPGQEDRTFDRMRAFISASVPDFQLTFGNPNSSKPGDRHISAGL